MVVMYSYENITTGEKQLELVQNICVNKQT